MSAPAGGLLHLHCGDCAADVARRSGLPGEVRVWRDSSAVGPCSADGATHRRVRAAWWDVAEAEMELGEDLPSDRDLVLWFGPDPWEQVSMIEVLAGVPSRRLSLVALDDGVSVMDPSDLRAPFDARRDASDLPEEICGLWQAFCADDRPALRAWIDRLRGHAKLPHLSAALARVLEDRDEGRTVRQVRALVDRGVTDVGDLMRELSSMEAPRHRVWYGDVVVRRIRDEMVPR